MLHKEIRLPFSNKFKSIPNIIFEILFYAIIGVTFFACLNLFSQQGLLMLISMGIISIYVLLKGKLILNIPFIGSLVFAFFYCLGVFIFTDVGILSVIVSCVMLPVLVQFFYCFENKKKFLLWLCGAYFCGFFASFLLMVISTYWHQGPAFSGDAINSFWNKGDIITRTALSINEIGLFAVLLSSLFFNSKYRRWFSLPLILFAIFLCLYVSLQIGNRSFIVSIFVLFYFIFICKYFSVDENKFWTAILIIFHVLFISFCVVYVLYSEGKIKLSENLLKINIINRIFNEDAQSRPNLLGEFFTIFYKHPFGGLTNELSNRYVHNVFLDFYTFGGIISFIVSTSFFVFLFIYLSYFVRLFKTHSIFERSIITCVIAAFIGLGFIEPIYQANPHCLTPLFIIFLYLRHCKQTEKIPAKVPVVIPFTDKKIGFFNLIWCFIKNSFINLFFKNNKISLRSKFKSNNLGGHNIVGSKTIFIGEIGKNSTIGSNCKLVANIKDNCEISSGVVLYLDEKQKETFNKKKANYFVVKDVPVINIGNNVKIGSDVKIKAGVTIGDGVIIKDYSVIDNDIFAK